MADQQQIDEEALYLEMDKDRRTRYIEIGVVVALIIVITAYVLISNGASSQVTSTTSFQTTAHTVATTSIVQTNGTNQTFGIYMDEGSAGKSIGELIGNYTTYSLLNPPKGLRIAGSSAPSLAGLEQEFPQLSGNVSDGWSTYAINSNGTVSMTYDVFQTSASSYVANALIGPLTAQGSGLNVSKSLNGTSYGMQYWYYVGMENSKTYIFLIGYENNYTVLFGAVSSSGNPVELDALLDSIAASLGLFTTSTEITTSSVQTTTPTTSITPSNETNETNSTLTTSLPLHH